MNPMPLGKTYVIANRRGDEIAEVVASTAQEALREARAEWPESWSATVKIGGDVECLRSIRHRHP